jgi:hypothetical protein
MSTYTQSQRVTTTAPRDGILDALEVQVSMVAKRTYLDGNQVNAVKLNSGLTSMLIKSDVAFMMQCHEDRAKISGKAECRPSSMFWLLAVLGFPGITLIVMYLYSKQRDLLKYEVNSIIQRTIMDLK